MGKANAWARPSILDTKPRSWAEVGLTAGNYVGWGATGQNWTGARTKYTTPAIWWKFAQHNILQMCRKTHKQLVSREFKWHFNLFGRCLILLALLQFSGSFSVHNVGIQA